MDNINPIILDGLKKYLDDTPSIPQGMQALVKKLLTIETHDSIEKSGIDKLYDQILGNFINDAKLIEWSKNYDG